MRNLAVCAVMPITHWTLCGVQRWPEFLFWRALEQDEIRGHCRGFHHKTSLYAMILFGVAFSPLTHCIYVSRLLSHVWGGAFRRAGHHAHESPAE
jgi:hypothetical protein